MVKRAGLPLLFPENVELAATDAKKRRDMVEERQRWEATTATGNTVARSALSRRSESVSKPDLFMSDMDRRLDPQSVAEDKTQLQKIMEQGDRSQPLSTAALPGTDNDLIAQAMISELVARAGAGNAFEGEKLGIGGLDDVLSQVKRRVWTPLAAPPKLLKELGISPVRGLLLYGRPGCVRFVCKVKSAQPCSMSYDGSHSLALQGKTLIARKIGQIFSPARPITVVAGPEIMDKFVGSSEKARQIWSNIPIARL
jgi:hypothetical protein